MKLVTVFDIDGTIADISGRLRHVTLRKGSLVKLTKDYSSLNLTKGSLATVLSLNLDLRSLHAETGCGSTIIDNLNSFDLVKDWSAFESEAHSDITIESICAIARMVGHSRNAKRVYCTGRSVSQSEATVEWLKKHDLWSNDDPLYMRSEGDFRPDYQVKIELMNEMIKDGFIPSVIFEDRGRVAQTLRRRGFKVCQVDEGKY